jgi:hypothetical protein
MILKTFIGFASSQKNLDILQSSVYGIGAVAKRMDQRTFSDFKFECLTLLSNIITASDAFSEDKCICTDNTIGALGKIAIYQGVANDSTSAQVLNKFLELLPLKNDSDEAQAIHKLFLEEIVTKNAYLVSCSQEQQNAMLQAIQNIRDEDKKNPESELVDDKTRTFIESLIGK